MGEIKTRVSLSFDGIDNGNRAPSWITGPSDIFSLFSIIQQGYMEILGSALGSYQRDKVEKQSATHLFALTVANPVPFNSEATYLVGVQGDPVGS